MSETFEEGAKRTEKRLKELFEAMSYDAEDKYNYLKSEGIDFDYSFDEINEDEVEEAYTDYATEQFLDCIVIKSRFGWGVDLCVCFGGPNCYIEITPDAEKVEFGYYWGGDKYISRWYCEEMRQAVEFVERYFSYAYEEFETFEDERSN